MENVFGIILKVRYDSVGDTASTELLGKTMLDWVRLSLGEAQFAAVEFDENLEVPLQVKHYADASKKYTVVLYSDTPLITKKTVVDAVAVAENGNLNVVRMTRGYVFRTAFLQTCEKLYTENTHYFAEEDFLTANSPHNFALISDVMRNRILRYHSERGVRFSDLGTTVVEGDVAIAAGVEVGPQNILKGKTVVREGAKLLYANVIEDGIIGEGAEINSSRIYRSYIGERTKVGPFAYIRPDSIIGPDCRIGDFVEIKNATVGDYTKASHLAYMGDVTIGERCNVGCGVIFVNYDGKTKHSSVVEDNCFIGSNCNIIAPVTLREGSYIAAGTTVTHETPMSSFVIGRSRQIIKESRGAERYGD